MKLNELDKNSKFGYRREEWGSIGREDPYIYFNGTEWRYVDHEEEADCELTSSNITANDWYLSDIPNRYYKRVAITTKNYASDFPKGIRIVQSDDWHPNYNRWVKADYSDNKSTFRSPGFDCEWEDEMEPEKSPFPCFRTHKWNNYTVMFTDNNIGEVVRGSDVFNVGHSSSNWVNYNDSVWEPCEDPRKRKFKEGDTIKYKKSSIHTITSIEDDRYRLEGNSYVLFTDEDLWELVQSTTPIEPKEAKNTNCSSEPIPTQKENTMDLRLLLVMMTEMSNEETPKDATNSKHVVIVTKDDSYEGYFYADDLEDIKDIVAEPNNELKKFHVFDYSTTLAQKPRKVVSVKR